MNRIALKFLRALGPSTLLAEEELGDGERFRVNALMNDPNLTIFIRLPGGISYSLSLKEIAEFLYELPLTCHGHDVILEEKRRF